MNENKVEHFLKNEYKKLVNFVYKTMEKRYADVSAEDIVQDVVLSLLNKLNVNEQIENIAAYIYRSLRNKILDNEKKGRKTILIDENNNVKDETEPYEMSLFERFNITNVHKAIEQLNTYDKYIINEIYFNGKTFQQLSVELNSPIGTLLSRKYRAQEKIQKILVKTQESRN